MKPVNTYAGSVEGDLAPEKVIEMGLDLTPEGMAHIISVVTDLYSDYELACIREYSCNGRDAMVEAGKGHLPIRVTTPSALNPYLIIEDEGVGLSIKDLEDVFSRYGASTKRGSDDFVGMLGLGGKSALTYTSQFMVTSVKDGIKAQIVVTRNEDGRGVMEVVDTRSTTEPNGVTIKIPVKGYNEFLDKANDFFYYWQPGTVLVNGKQPKHLVSEKGITKIGDSIYLIDSKAQGGYAEYNANDVIVMGGVGYPMTENGYNRSLTERATHSSYHHTVAFVEMGEVTFTPSREALAYSDRTRETIAKLQKTISDEIAKQISSDLTNAASYSEAFSLWNKWGKIVEYKNLPKVQYKGHDFLHQIECEYAYVDTGSHNRWSYPPGTGRTKSGDKSKRIMPMQAFYSTDSVFVINYPNDTAPAGGSRQKISIHLTNIGKENSVVYLFPGELPGDPWTSEIDTYDWSEIKGISIAAARKSNTGKIPALVYKSEIHNFQYSRGSANGYGVWEDKTLDPNHPIVYVSPASLNDRWNGHLHRNMIAHLTRWDGNIQIVKIGANRFDKFVRENPTAKRLADFYENDLPKMIQDSLTEDEKLWASYDSTWHVAAEKIGDKVDDEEIQALAKIAKTVDRKRAAEYNGTRTEWPYILIDDYDLKYREEHRQHAIIYINAVHKKGK